jgi:hypothetical protein
MSDITHYTDCWQDPRHHECALREIERLLRICEYNNTRAAACEDELQRKEAEIERLRDEEVRLTRRVGKLRMALEAITARAGVADEIASGIRKIAREALASE